MSNEKPSGFMEVKDAAKYFKIKASELQRLAKAGKLTVEDGSEGGAVRVLAESVREYKETTRKLHKQKRKYTKRTGEEDTDAGTSTALTIDERDVIYAFARAEKELEIYADSLGVPKAELTNRVGQLLQAQAGGRRVGARH